MAHAFPADQFSFGIARARRTDGSRSRFALALTGSLFFHVSLGMGGAPELPRLSFRPDAFRFTAQLEQPAVDPKREARSGPNVAAPEASTVTPASKPSLAASDSVSRNQRRSGAVITSVRTADAPEVPLELPRPVEKYYTVLDLDVYPSARAPLEVEYPERTTGARVSGRVLVMLALDETGNVDDISVVKGEPEGYFEDAVRRKLSITRFLPAQKNGIAVKSRILLSVEIGAASGQVKQ
jgi:periplasmic protein TonB